MKNTLAIIKANLRKGKGQAVNLLAFTLISALLLSLGLLLMLGFGNVFEKRAEALNAPHFALMEEERIFSQSQINYIKNYPGVTGVEYEKTLSFVAEITYGDGKMPAYFFFVNMSAKRQMNDLAVIEGKVPVASNEVCLPSMFRSGGYGVGDNFKMTVGDKVLTFKISGFGEEIMFGSINNQIYQLYLSDAGYRALADKRIAIECMVIRAQLENPTDADTLFLSFIKEFFYSKEIDGASTLYIQSLNWNSVKQIRTMMSSITSIILIVFSALIVLVSLLVIRFRIRNSIEESMTNIGALKAVGYTGKQLLWANVLQFCGIALVGIVLGIGLSYVLVPVVSQILEQQTALQWQPGFDPLTSGITLVSILLAVLVVTWLSAYRIKKLQPLAALRQGLSTHSFRKNHFPLDRSRGALSWLLAMKSVMQARGQMVMIAVIVTMVSFMAVAGLAVYDNLGLRSENFARILAGEIPDATFVGSTPEDAKAIRSYLEKDSRVRKVFYDQDANVLIGDHNVSNTAVEDFSLFEGSMLYEGQYPRHNNEICLSGALASYYNIKVGDTVKVRLGAKSLDYLVVGLIQSVNNGGIISSMTIEGYRRLEPGFEPREMFVYLHDAEQTAALIDAVSLKFGPGLDSAVNLAELMTAQLSMYGDIFFMVAVVLVAVTALVIFLVLYLILKTLILRRRRELGIQKALGFTTLQLMNQLALYFIPVITLGIAAGGVIGALGFNSMFVALTRGMGIMTASMPAPIGMTVVLCALLVVLSYAFAMLIAARIRRISAYALVTE